MLLTAKTKPNLIRISSDNVAGNMGINFKVTLVMNQDGN
jgi:hypothetical protein